MSTLSFVKYEFILQNSDVQCAYIKHFKFLVLHSWFKISYIYGTPEPLFLTIDFIRKIIFNGCKL